MTKIKDLTSRGSQRATPHMQRYVRVTNSERKGFVEFNYSIGDPTLFLEMILPVAAFEEFCRINNARFLTPEQEDAVDRNEAIWHDSVMPPGDVSINEEQQS